MEIALEHFIVASNCFIVIYDKAELEREKFYF